MNIKKTIPFLLAITLLLSLAACNKSEKDSSNPAADEKKVTVYLATKHSENDLLSANFKYDSNGNKLEETSYSDGKKNYLYEYKYDSNHNLIEKAKYDRANVLVERCEYKYNEKNHLISETYYNKNSTEYERYEFVRDNAGNMLEKRKYSRGIEQSRYTYTYDAAGRELTCRFIAAETQSFCESQYDNNGNLTKRTLYTDGKESTRDEYTYNDAGKPTEWVNYSEGKEIYRHKYKYDNNGNQIEQMEYYKGRANACLETSYDKSGNPIEQVYRVNLQELYRYTFTYDARGNLTEKNYTNRSYSEHTAYTYDANNNLLQSHRVSSNGETYTEAFEYISVTVNKPVAEKMKREYGEKFVRIVE